MAKRLEARVDRLEILVSQQGYVVYLLMIVFAFDTAGLLWLWQDHGKPDFDHIAVALSAFQITFGVAALYGFWAVRGLTKERAAEVAEEVALQEARRLIPSIVAREITENGDAFRRNDPISDADVASMVTAIGEDEEDERG